MARLASETAKRMLLSTADDDGQGRAGDVRAGMGDGRQLPQGVAVLDGYEVPGLAVAGAGGEASGFKDALNDFFGNGVVAIGAYGEDGANGLKDLHVEAPSLRPKCEEFLPSKVVLARPFDQRRTNATARSRRSVDAHARKVPRA